MIVVDSSDVEIAGLTLNGDNPALETGGDTTVNGAHIHARNGIIEGDPGPYSNLSVHNVTVENIYLRGIYARSPSAVNGFNISHNVVTNVAGGPQSVAIFNYGGGGIFSYNTVSYAGDAISANHSTGTEFAFNIVTNSGSGIHTDNNGDSGGTADSIHDNNVSLGTAGAYGIFVFVPYDAVTVQNNIISGVDVGLAAFGGQGGSAAFSGNQVSVNTGGTGALVTTDTLGYGQMNVSASFNGDSFTDGDTGILVKQNPGATAAVTISGATISGNSTGIDAIGGNVLAQNNNLAGNGEGVVISGGATVDLGYDPSDLIPGHANFTGLGSSTGHNTLTGYAGGAGHYAIDDQNTPQGTQPDVLAEDNNFGPYGRAIPRLSHRSSTTTTTIPA